MKRFALALGVSALMFIAAPALAHERSGGNCAYPSHQTGYYGYNQNYGYYGGRVYRPSYGWGNYPRPVVIYRQGPPHGRAWGYRRHHPAAYAYSTRNAWYQGGGWNGNRNGSGRRDHEWDD